MRFQLEFYSGHSSKEGNRNIVRNIEHYNLDIVLSVGYRTNSVKATKFRQWATSVLKTYIQNGYR